MADHGEAQYASATGNDYPAHEQAYETFTHIVIIGLCHVVNIVLALAIGTVIGNIGVMVGILIVATIVALHGLLTGARVPSGVMVVISLLLLAFCAVA
jgi:ATP/ADP translocase